MPTYNHMFDIAFSLESEDGDHVMPLWWEEP
jgi:hypothetical protein